MWWLLLTGALCLVPAWAYADPDASTDASVDASPDASEEADSGIADAEADAPSNDASPKDSGGPCVDPSLPCTSRPDGANTVPEASDEAGTDSSGCSCNTTPDAATFSPLLILGAAALVSARRRRASKP